MNSVTRRERLVRVALLMVCAVGMVAAAPAQEDLPEPARYVWEAWGTVVLPLPELLEQGLLAMTQATENRQQPDLVMVDLATGEILWSVNLPSKPRAINTTGGVLLLALWDRVAAVSVADGSVGWQQPLEGMLNTGGDLTPEFQQSQWFRDRNRPGQGIGGAFLAANGMFYVTVDGTTYALRPSSGAIAWQRKVGFSLSSPLVACGDAIIAATMDQGLGALSAESGEVLWSLDLKHVSEIFVLEGELYCASNEGLWRLDPASGDVIWGRPLPADQAEVLYAVGDRLVVQRTGDVSVFGRADGEPLRQFETRRMASVIAGGQVVYATGQSGAITCVGVADLQPVWQAPFGSIVLSRLLVADDTVVAIAPDLVSGYDLASGEKLWSYQPRPGRLIHSETWATGSGCFFFHLPDQVLGCASRSGEWTLALPGEFFFVHWMHVRDDTLYLHSGEPSEESLGAIPLVAAAGG